MRRKILFFLFILPVFTFAQVQTVTYSISPTVFEENQSVTITINGNSVNEATWGITNNSLYMWAWSYDLNDVNSLDCPTNGSWDNSGESNKFTYNSGNDTYTMTFVPQTFFNRTGIGKFGFLVKAKDGSGDKKSQDIYIEVGAFSVTLINPDTNGGTLFVNNGGNVNLMAQNSNGNAVYELYANGNFVTTQTTDFFNYNFTNITENKYCTLNITQNSYTITKNFTIVINPGTISATLPNGMLDGINYTSADPSKATLVLTAPGKDFVYVAGNFNNWQPNTSFAMKKDPTTGKFWLEVSGLTSGQLYAYQYWVFDTTPITNSPKLVKTADPFSTLVLSPWDDPEIITLGNYPGLPQYNTIAPGQEREVTVLQTGQTSYNWQVPNFVKPLKDDLVIYEVLIRDFDTPRTYQSLIDRIDYFKNLKVNAIELMPIMEFEGNEGWGYNPSFHLANDKFYGTGDKLKEFIDLCHQNGIAVILDVALNHAMGRNPMVRMWMNDPENDGWGGPSSENPYFNVTATHSYGVGNDFNHSSSYTRDYVKRVIKHWVNEYKIDGFRWDLTKGFTQNCSPSDQTCTNSYQPDRVAVMKEYADYSWSLDPNHYVIFEHLGTPDGSLTEETEWANYRYNEGKGIMLWGEMTWAYRQLTMGFDSSANITRMGSDSRGFLGNRLVGYPESHDKERLMYDNITYGNNSNASYNVRDLNTALGRMSALGATSLLIPGPKMIWHFGDLGDQISIYTCSDGSINTESDATPGDCKLATKPQPQWTENWLANTQRSKIYNDWAKMIQLKINEPVFEGDYTMESNDTDLTPIIWVYNNALASDQLKNVVILANFQVTDQGIIPFFPYTGTWYNLMDNSTINVTSTQAPINIEAGGFRIYGNKASTLSHEDFLSSTTQIYPNPARDSFSILTENVINDIQIFDLTGKRIKTFSNSNDNTFDISDLNPSLYFIKIQTNNGVSTQRLIVE